MRKILLTAIIVSAWSFAAMPASDAQPAAAPDIAAQAPATPQPAGVYTQDQAGRGKTLYDAHCASCHGPTLAGGGEAPPLVGQAVLYNWNGQTAADLVDRIQTSMPEDSPGSLDRKTVADITAYILAANQFPAGPAELPDDAATLGKIPLKAAAQ